MANKDVLIKKKRRAKRLFDDQRFKEAKKLYTEILKVDTSDSEAWLLLGCVNHYMGLLNEAEHCMRKLLQLKPQASQAYNNLASILKDQGKLAEAVEKYMLASQINPNDPQVYYNLAHTYELQGKENEAIDQYHLALRLIPNLAQALQRIGNIHHRQGRFQEAERYLLDAVAIDVNNHALLNDLGNLACDLGKPAQAIEYYQKSLQLSANAATYTNLANVLRSTGRLSDAVAQYQAAIEANPNDAYAYNFLANTLKDQGLLDEACSLFEKSCALMPEVALNHSNQLVFMNYQPDYNAAAVFAAHMRWGEIHELSHEQAQLVKQTSQRRIKIGYVSPDFCNHAVAYFIEPLLTHYNRDDFEIYCYANLARPDVTSERFMKLVDHWVPIFHLNDQLAAEKISQDGIDILVDLAGHTRNNRLPLFALKPAPIQVNYLGYPNTSGLKAMDYRLTDSFCDPQGSSDSFYTEQLLRLPQSFFCYQPPTTGPEVGSLPASSNGYITFGSFNILAKINPQVIKLWADVLKAVTNSKLLIQTSSFSDQPTAEWIAQCFASHGVDKKQLIFEQGSSFATYLAHHNKVDIILDTFPWNGHTTSCHALWMGVPMITLTGDHHAARMGTSILQNLGLNEFIAVDTEDYINKARQHATDIEHLALIRTGLRERLTNSSLCDAKTFCRDIEGIYKKMLQNLK